MKTLAYSRIGGKVFRASSEGVPVEFQKEAEEVLAKSEDWNTLLSFTASDPFKRLHARVLFGGHDDEAPRLWVDFIFESGNMIFKDKFDIIAPEEVETSFDEFLRDIKATHVDRKEIKQYFKKS